MCDLRSFWKVVADELAARCCTDSTALDYKIVESRSGSEGLAFFAKTLPLFGKDLEKGLDQSRVTRELFQGWRKLSSNSGPGVIPQFLGGFMSLIFDRNSGALLDEPDIDAIFAVRQLTLMYSKILIPASDDAVKRAMSDFLECEYEVRRFDAERSSDLLEEFRNASTVLWGTVLQAVDEDVYHGNIIPRHGPGATSDRLRGNRKFDQVEWTERLERVFHWNDFIIPSARYHSEYLPSVKFVEPGAERPVRVITVPKTFEKPRVIAIEPTCMQYVQQGIKDRLVDYLESSAIERDSIPGWGRIMDKNIGFGVVGFEDQEPNRLMAQRGSLSGELATLDLSEASDRVSNQLVRAMLENYPNLAEGVDASRSRKADVRGHGVIRLAKFASMGSALTFPIEAMVFSTVVFIGIAKAIAEQEGSESRARVDTDLIMRYRSEVRVYGDDIVVPVRFVQRVVDTLELYGFKVNSNKSFWTGKFRESCGKEYYDGQDVSIVKVRRFFPSRPEHGLDAHGHPGTVRSNQRKRNRRQTTSVGDGRSANRKFRGQDPLQPVQPATIPNKGIVSGVQAQGIVATVELRNQAYMLGLWSTARFLDGYLQKVLTHYPTVSPESPALGRVSLLGYETQRIHSKTHSPQVKAWRVRPKSPKSSVSGVGALLKCLLMKPDGTNPVGDLDWLMAITNVDAEHLNRAGRPRSVSITSGWTQPF